MTSMNVMNNRSPELENGYLIDLPTLLSFIISILIATLCFRRRFSCSPGTPFLW